MKAFRLLLTIIVLLSSNLACELGAQPLPTATPISTPKPLEPPPFDSIIVVKVNDNTYAPIPNWPMTLFASAGCQGQSIATGETDRNGVVEFDNLQPIVYSVQEELIPAYQAVTQACQDVDLSKPDSPSGSTGGRDQPITIYPTAGEDAFDSGAHVMIDIPVLGTDMVTLNGPTVVKRSDPYDPGDGWITIDTELISMNLVGTSSILGPITVRESPSRQSLGIMKQQSPGVDFPADSFFDVFFEIDTKLGTLHNQSPIRMQAYNGIDAIPPILRGYIPPTPIVPTPPVCVTLYNSFNIAVGCIKHAIHVPLPPREKIIVFVNRLTPPMPPFIITDDGFRIIYTGPLQVQTSGRLEASFQISTPDGLPAMGTLVASLGNPPSYMMTPHSSGELVEGKVTIWLDVNWPEGPAKLYISDTHLHGITSGKVYEVAEITITH